MNDIYYLVHASNKNLDKAKYLLAPSCTKAENKDQFPGVYFSSKYNIDTESYFPWQLQQFADKIKVDPYTYNMNEVVFHDNVPMQLCCKKLKKGVDILPHKAKTTKATVDKHKLLFYE
jgi:hypothetical protein